MLQVFHLDVAKVCRDVAHVTMAIHVCLKCLFQMFYLFFEMYVTSVLSECCICFTRMLQVFYLDVTYVCNGFFQEFPSVWQVF